MLTLPPGARLLLATSRVNGRKGINGLSTLVRSQFFMDPLSGTLFVFFTKRADIVRVLYWDRDGYVLTTKRLEKEISWLSQLPFVSDQHCLVAFAVALLDADGPAFGGAFATMAAVRSQCFGTQNAAPNPAMARRPRRSSCSPGAPPRRGAVWCNKLGPTRVVSSTGPKPNAADAPDCSSQSKLEPPARFGSLDRL